MKFDDVEAVLFDFDGTLVHLNIDFGQMRREVEAILPRYGLATDDLSARYTLELVEEAAGILARRNGDVAAFRQEAQAAITAIEMAAAETARVHPGVPHLLASLRERGIRVAIVTRNCRAAVESILRRYELPYDALVTRDDVRRVKPDPEHLLTAMQRLGVSPARTLMVGDHPLDIRAGRLAGTRTVAVLTGYSAAEQFAPEQPDMVLEEAGKLAERVRGGQGDKGTRRQGDKETRRKNIGRG